MNQRIRPDRKLELPIPDRRCTPERKDSIWIQQRRKREFCNFLSDGCLGEVSLSQKCHSPKNPFARYEIDQKLEF